MIIDTKKIQKLLDSPITDEYIEEKTGIERKSISNYRTDNAKIMNMTLETASKLARFFDEIDELEEEKLLPEKISGIKTAVKGFNQWYGDAIIHFDKRELKVWTRVYTSPISSLTKYRYDQEYIVEVAWKITQDMEEYDKRVTMRQIQELCDAALNEN